jgi:hypothetical protein
MLKRTLIAVAVVALMATTVQAYGPDAETGQQGKNAGFKIHPIKMDIFWPFVEYKAIDLCTIPVKMEVGIFVQVEKCHEKKIILKQKECGDLGRGLNSNSHWPCYTGCTNVKVRSNFDIKLGLKKAKSSGSILDKWEAYFAEGSPTTVNAGTGWTEVTVCVDAWQAKLYELAVDGVAGEKVDVGTVTITVKPNV